MADNQTTPPDILDRLRDASDYTRLALVGHDGLCAEAATEIHLLRKLISDLSDFLTDEGCDLTNDGLHSLRVRAATALGDQCPDWLRSHQVFP